MSGQCSSTSNWLRFQSIAKIVDDIKPFTTSSGCFNAFTKFIGYQPGTNTREPYYSKLDVPVLYDGWQGKKDFNTLFHNPILLKVCQPPLLISYLIFHQDSCFYHSQTQRRRRPLQWQVQAANGKDGQEDVQDPSHGPGCDNQFCGACESWLFYFISFSFPSSLRV